MSTTNYSITLPVVGSDEDQWGTKINNAFQSVDDLLGGDTPVTNIDINSGTIDGATIGANNAQEGNFTDVEATGLITGNVKGDIKANNGATVLNNGTDGTDATFTGSSASLTNARAFSVSGDVATSAGVNFDGTGAVDLSVAITNAMYDKIYPNGSIYATTDANFDPNNSFNGDWFLYAQGKVLVGQNTNDSDFATVGQEGGAKTHTLTIAEMPSHTHEYKYSDQTQVQLIGSTVTNISEVDEGGERRDTLATGGSDPHNNLQPYKVVIYWHRNDQ